MKTSFKSLVSTLAILVIASAVVGTVIWLLVDAVLGGAL